jgi:hypothetical protein
MGILGRYLPGRENANVDVPTVTPTQFAFAVENSDRSIRYETLNRPWGEHVHTHNALHGKTVAVIVMLGELNIWKIARTDMLSNPYIPQIGALGAKHIIHMWRHTRAMIESLWEVD